jgi:heme/copper-type cytochrome/quinol oxidase subunit 2
MQVLSNDDRMLGPNLVVRPGRVELTIVNRATHAHLFSVPALGIQHVVLPGSPSAPTITTVRFTVPAGVFHWFCAFPCNRSMSGDIYAVANPPSLRGPLWAAA